MRGFQTYLLVLSTLALAACEAAEDAKPKLAIESAREGKSNLDETISAASTGNWRELQTINSPHNYRNNYTKRWEVTGSPDALELRFVFTRFELESGYDFLAITDGAGGQRTSYTGTQTGVEVVITGNRSSVSMTTDASVTKWGARLQVFERLPCACTEIYNPVCGSDGVTYPNNCHATCENVTVAHSGTCSDVWTGVGRLIESEHPYRDNFSNTWEISEGGATRIRIHFSRIDLERGYDYVTILDGSDRIVARYTGSEPNGITAPPVEGGTAKIRFETDSSVTKWGFAIDSYEVQGGCNTDSDCPSNETCVMVQCIRAPCFNSCAPRVPASYELVTLADLEAAPERYNGHSISVVAEPVAPAAVCTKIACSPSNPCCNRCSAQLQIGERTRLEDPSNAQSYMCAGDNCSWASQCSPFPSENAGPYELRGTFSDDPVTGLRRLLVDSFQANACQQTGCSGNMCANHAVFSTCVYRPEYACYQTATCAAQADGMCGFTATPELTQCLANGGPTSTPETITARDTPIAVPDNNTRGVSSTITLPAQLARTLVRVSARVTHTYRGDLLIVLVQPNGREVVLHDRSGGSYDNVVIEDYVLGELDGADIGGDWKLRVSDHEPVDTGSIEAFSVTLR